MDANISVLNDNKASEANELFQWLRGDRGLRNPVSLTARDVEPGKLSPVVEIIVAAIGSGGIAQLIGSLRGWLLTRSAELTIEVRTEKGRVQIIARKVGRAEIEALMRILREDEDNDDDRA